MSIFKSKLKASVKRKLPIEPIELYQTCQYKEEYGYLRGIQEEVLNEWHRRRSDRDVICKMSTGSGKTLTGLLMLYSKMVELKQPVLYVCPDNQLVKQTIGLAALYGIPVCEFEGNSSMIPLHFKNYEAILVCNFQKLFNGKSVFNRDNISLGAIVIDDAHKCLDIGRSQSTIKIERGSNEGNAIFNLFAPILKEQLPGSFRLLDQGDPLSFTKVPYWAWMEQNEEVIDIIYKLFIKGEGDIIFSWKFFENNSLAYDCYIGGHEIEISPIHVPYHEIPSFNHAKHRYILSATFEDDYDLIRDLGIEAKSIEIPIVPKNRKDIGKRLILAPQRYNTAIGREELMHHIADYHKHGFNTVVLVPSSAKAKEWEKLGASVTNRDEISKSLKKLGQSNKNFLVIYGRYEGIDLHNNLCRVLVIDGMPTYYSLRENYMETRMHSLISSKKAQILEQGLGRATRSGGDYSVNFLLGEDLLSFIGVKDNLKYFTTVTNKHLNLGLTLLNEVNPDCVTLETITEAAKSCLGQDPDWHEYHTQFMQNDDYLQLQGKSKLVQFAEIEAEAISNFRKRKFVEAGNIINQKIINEFGGEPLTESERCWYYQLAAQFFYPGDKVESNNLQIKAAEGSHNLFIPQVSYKYKQLKPLGVQAEVILKNIQRFSSSHDVVLYVKEILITLNYNPDIPAKKFEDSLQQIGSFLGFAAMSPEKETGNGPDGLWCLSDSTYLILEAKSRAVHTEISKDNINQLLGSVEWFKKYYPSGSYFAVTLQPVNVKGTNVNISEETRVIDSDALEKLKKNIVAFTNALYEKSGKANLDVSKIKEYLITYNLTVEDFKKSYLKGINNKK